MYTYDIKMQHPLYATPASRGGHTIALPNWRLHRYSQAVKANGLVFVSGRGPFDPATGDVVGETIQEQTRQCLRNVEAMTIGLVGALGGSRTRTTLSFRVY